jgi:hypothetical protein
MPEKLTLTPLTDLDKARIQRLAGDMRVGAKLRPQCTNVLWKHVGGTVERNAYASCAFGAAWEGAHPDFNPVTWYADGHLGIVEIIDEYQIAKIVVTHPVTAMIWHLDSIITNLNDMQDWTREAIADWLIRLTQ